MATQVHRRVPRPHPRGCTPPRACEPSSASASRPPQARGLCHSRRTGRSAREGWTTGWRRDPPRTSLDEVVEELGLHRKAALEAVQVARGERVVDVVDDRANGNREWRFEECDAKGAGLLDHLVRHAVHVVSDADAEGHGVTVLQAIEQPQTHGGGSGERDTRGHQYHAGSHPWRRVLEIRQMDALDHVVETDLSGHRNDAQASLLNEFAYRQVLHGHRQYSSRARRALAPMVSARSAVCGGPSVTADLREGRRALRSAAPHGFALEGLSARLSRSLPGERLQAVGHRREHACPAGRRR